MNRISIVFFLSILIWILGLGSIFSFNIWSELKLFGLTFLGLLDYLTNNIMLPLGGFFVTVLIGWLLPKEFLKEHLKLTETFFYWFYLTLRFIAPSSIILIFLYSAF